MQKTQHYEFSFFRDQSATTEAGQIVQAARRGAGRDQVRVDGAQIFYEHAAGSVAAAVLTPAGRDEAGNIFREHRAAVKAIKTGATWTVHVRSQLGGGAVALAAPATGKFRRFRSWEAALAAGLEEVLLQLGAKQAEERAARSAAFRAEQRARYEAIEAQATLERHQEGHLERLEAARDRYASEAAGAIHWLNLGEKDLGRRMNRDDLLALDATTLKMLREELDVLSTALRELSTYQNSIARHNQLVAAALAANAQEVK